MVKTTIDLDEDRWKKFSIKVIEEHGGRKKNDIIEALIDGYVNDSTQTIQEAIDEWIRELNRRKSKGK